MTIYELVKKLTNMSVTVAILPYRDTDHKNVGFRVSMVDELTTKTYRKDFLYSKIEKLVGDEPNKFDSILFSILVSMKNQIVDERPKRLKEGENNG